MNRQQERERNFTITLFLLGAAFVCGMCFGGVHTAQARASRLHRAKSSHTTRRER